MIDRRRSIILVTGDAKVRGRVEGLYRDNGTSVAVADGLQAVLPRPESAEVDLVVVCGDALEGCERGQELLTRLSERRPTLPILLLAERDEDCVPEPEDFDGPVHSSPLPAGDKELKLLIDRMARERRPGLIKGSRLSGEEVGNEVRWKELLGRSPAMQEIYGQLLRAASTDIPVLLEGETGTGKDVAAREIHRKSARRRQPFIPVNLAALPRELVGSELFGHERGSFTGAIEERQGKFELAAGGTVFLDEIGAIEEKVQVSLLRLIEQKKFFRLGGRREITVDARLIAATNDNLSRLVREGRFRSDLFYRLDVFRIVMPPLRRRREDIPLLADSFLRAFRDSLQRNIRDISPEFMQCLLDYQWPGNVRELKNVIQRAALVCEDEVLRLEHLPPRFHREELALTSFPPLCLEEGPGEEPARPPAAMVTFQVGTPLQQVEREMVARTLHATLNNRKKVAEMLGISRRSLYNKLIKYNLL